MPFFGAVKKTYCRSSIYWPTRYTGTFRSARGVFHGCPFLGSHGNYFNTGYANGHLQLFPLGIGAKLLPKSRWEAMPSTLDPLIFYAGKYF
jgi:hypothetical protein